MGKTKKPRRKPLDTNMAPPDTAAAPPVSAGRPSALLDTRVVYCGDCLEQLRKLPPQCIDLIYIDAPFNSNRSNGALMRIARIGLCMSTMIALIFSAVGCANGYSQFYSGTRYSKTKAASLISSTAQLGPSAVEIGRTSFVGALVGTDKAVSAARSLGANVVLVSPPAVADVVTGVMPISQYHPGDTYTTSSNFQGSVYSPGQYPSNFNGTSTGTITGSPYTTTTYVPYSVPRYNHYATFYRDPSFAGLPNSP